MCHGGRAGAATSLPPGPHTGDVRDLNRESGPRRRLRQLVWTTASPTRAQLRREYDHVLRYDELRRTVERSRAAGTGRSSLANPAAALLARFARHAHVAVVAVPCATVADLRVLHGYVVEPAFRRGCALLVHADRDLATMPAPAYVDRDWGYPWTLERLRHLAARYCLPQEVPEPERVRWRVRVRAWLSRAGDGADDGVAARSRLDPQQAAAARAGDGVVQVIAPAGSGKTTVLVERVRTLRDRGVVPDRILCSTFNRDACREIGARLAGAGLDGVVVRSFHGLGRAILVAERQLRGQIGVLGYAEWRRLAREAMEVEPDGVWIDAPEAQAAVSAFKLAAMVDPAAARDLAGDQGPRARTAARIFGLYEERLRQRGMHDFDDLIAVAVALLRTDAGARRRWQERFDRVLVDEYQDIEPAQALLVGILAAPQDSLFCVGDEDQCIYAWRRATVERVVELDQVYPGLERYPLVRNYRCGRRITDASRRVIEHNRRRFRKPILAGAAHAGEILVRAAVDRPSAAAFVADRLRGAARGKTAVLARTTALLREVALACARRGLAFDAPARVLQPSGARETLAAYLRLLSAPEQADPADVERAFSAPSRHLPGDAVPAVVESLRAGATFTAALAALSVEPWRRPGLAAAGALLDALAAEPDAERLILRLRTDGGLDRHYASQERLNPTEQVEVETLAWAQAAARGLTGGEFATRIGAESRLLRAHRSDQAVELVTIHGAKGREWDHVLLFGADQGQLPHSRALAAGDGAGGIEDERRLCYVALTRAKARLEIVCSASEPSQFLAEAGLRVPRTGRHVFAGGTLSGSDDMS